NHSVHRALMPMPDEDDVVIGIDPDRIRPIAERREARRRRARPLSLLGVEPPEVAVIRTMLARRDGVAKPLLGHELAAAPLSSVENEETKSRQILRVDPEPAAPARAATHRSDCFPVDLDL